MHVVKKLIEPKAVACIASLLLMLCTVVLLPVGVASNGQPDWSMQQNNLYHLEFEDTQPYFEYVNIQYGIRQYFNEVQTKAFNPSTHNLAIRAAVGLDTLLGGDAKVFDIRVLGVMLSLLLALNVYLLTDFLAYGKSKAAGYAIAALVVFVLVDTGYTAYFNTFYTNGLQFTTLLLALTLLLLMQQQRYSAAVLGLAYLLVSLVFIFCDLRTAWVGVVLGLLFFMLPQKSWISPSLPGSVLQKQRYVTSLALAAAGVLAFALLPSEIDDIGKYNTMTRGVIKTSQNREQSLHEFNIYRQYTLLQDSTVYDKYPIAFVDSEEFAQDFSGRFSFMDVGWYYLRHLPQFYEMTEFALSNSYSIRLHSMGNFTRESGKEPRAQTDFFTLYSMLKDEFVPRTVGFALLWLGLLYFFFIRSAYDGKIMTLIAMIGFLQIPAAIIGAGDADMTRNLFLFNVIFDFLNVIVGASLLNAFVYQRHVNQKKRSKLKSEGS